MTSVRTSERFEPGCVVRPANRARRPRGSKAFHGGIGHLHFNVVLHARRPRDHHAGDGARPIPFQALPFHRQWNGRHRLAAHHVRDPASLEVLIRCKCGYAPEQDGQSNSSKQSSDFRNVVNRGVDGIIQLVFEYGAEFREGFVIGAWLVQVNFCG